MLTAKPECAACPVAPLREGAACRGQTSPSLCRLVAAGAIRPERVAALPPSAPRPDPGPTRAVDVHGLPAPPPRLPPPAAVRPGAEPPLPSLGRQIGGFLGTAAKVVGSGFALASQEEQDARLAVCREAAGLTPDQTIDGHCDHYRASDGRCGGMTGCGCYLKGKVTFKASQCPLGRWPV